MDSAPDFGHPLSRERIGSKLITNQLHVIIDLMVNVNIKLFFSYERLLQVGYQTKEAKTLKHTVAFLSLIVRFLWSYWRYFELTLCTNYDVTLCGCVMPYGTSE